MKTIKKIANYIAFNILLYLFVSFIQWDIFVIKKIPALGPTERGCLLISLLLLNFLFHIENSSKIKNKLKS